MTGKTFRKCILSMSLLHIAYYVGCTYSYNTHNINTKWDGRQTWGLVNVFWDQSYLFTVLPRWVTPKQCLGPYTASWTIISTVLYYFCQYNLPI